MQGIPAAFDRPHARKASPHGKVIQDILGFWIQRCEFRILDTGFRNSCQFGTRIPDSKAQDSGFHKQRFPGSGTRITLQVATGWLAVSRHVISQAKISSYLLFQSRFAVNSVTAADYGRPFRIAAFVAELDAGFRLLNLKNDSLRKKFDGLKYDLKKIEEVVYDLTIRGLKPASAVTETT